MQYIIKLILYWLLQDNDGYIEPNEMEALVDELHLNELFPRNYLMHLFSEADKDKDGRISFEGHSFLENLIKI